jgi:tRNA nucleotidyltransferase (CCA-adding enzyme)
MTNWHARQALTPAEEEIVSSPEDIEFQQMLVDFIETCATEFGNWYESLDVSSVKTYLVGGAVREIVRGNNDKIKDWDFAVEADDWYQMKKWVETQGFEIFVETPQYMTIRARAPKGYEFAGIDMTGRTFDFALCRTDGEYSDGRRPDTVEVATLESDLSRRDFTMNAMAMDSEGNIIDPFNGREAIESKEIRLVGGPDRLLEDPLRMLRAIRFSLQLGFYLDDEIWSFLANGYNTHLLKKVDENRIRDEITKCFKINTYDTLKTLQGLHHIEQFIFQETNIWLMPTVKGK